jgi:hypothetical protein
LAAVALVAFLAGLLIGRGVAPSSPSEAAQSPVALQGVVRFATRGNVQADVGAVVLALPENKVPAAKIPLAGMRPSEQPAIASQAALAAIGGGVTRVAADGSYQLPLSQPGQYCLVIISRHAQRPGEAAIDAFQLAMLERYFDRPQELIGRSQYLWKVQNVRGSAQLDHTFAAGG